MTIVNHGELIGDNLCKSNYIIVIREENIAGKIAKTSVSGEMQ